MDDGSYDGVTGLDDIEFTNCGTPPPSSGCDEGFRCSVTGACVSSSLICDAVDDCGDNSDEASCGKDFFHFTLPNKHTSTCPLSLLIVPIRMRHICHPVVDSIRIL